MNGSSGLQFNSTRLKTTVIPSPPGTLFLYFFTWTLFACSMKVHFCGRPPAVAFYWGWEQEHWEEVGCERKTLSHSHLHRFPTPTDGMKNKDSVNITKCSSLWQMHFDWLTMLFFSPPKMQPSKTQTRKLFKRYFFEQLEYSEFSFHMLGKGVVAWKKKRKRRSGG